MKTNYPFIPQKSHDGCAIAVLTMACHYFGINIKYNDVDLIFKDRNLNLNQLSVYLKKHNLDSKAFLIKTKDFEQIANFPLILHYQNHFVIAYARAKDYVLIADPSSFGIKKVNILKVRKLWSGYALDLSNNQVKPLLNLEKHLPYNFRLFLLNVLIIVILILILN